MRAGLVASTATPGKTAPLVSRTTPAIPAWPNAAVDVTPSQAIASAKHDKHERMAGLLTALSVRYVSDSRYAAQSVRKPKKYDRWPLLYLPVRCGYYGKG